MRRSQCLPLLRGGAERSEAERLFPEQARENRSRGLRFSDHVFIAGVGGGATFASLIVLGTLGLPIEIVGILASVEPLIDMGRTALNVSDSMVAGITSSHVNGGFNRDVFNDPNAQVSAAGEIEA